MPRDELVEKVARAIAHARSWQTKQLTVGDWDDRSKAERQPFIEMANAALSAISDTGGVDPTQRGDEIAAQMRAYFDAHRADHWPQGGADNLMLGLLNIVLRAERNTRPNTGEIERWRDSRSEPPPRDGTAIIAFWPHLQRPVVAWTCVTNRRAGKWVASHNTSYTSALATEPSHWMPLPEPPSAILSQERTDG